jgi:hypothetical protein
MREMGPLNAQVLEGREHDFRIGMTAERKRADGDLVKLATQLRRIVNLAVENNHVTPARRHHRLVTRGRKIENGQSPVAQGDAGRYIYPGS